MMSTNMVSQGVQSIIPVLIPQTIPPSPLVQPETSVTVLQDGTVPDRNKPILNSLLSSGECLGKSSAPQTIQPVPVKMLPTFPAAASSVISVPTSSVARSNQKYAVVVASSGGVTKTLLMPIGPVTPSNQAAQNPSSVVMPSINGPSQTGSAPGGRIIIQCPARTDGQHMTTLLSPPTIQSSKPVFSYNPANITVKTPVCPTARSIPPIVHNNCNQTVLTVVPQLATSHLSETNVSRQPVNDLMSISPIVIAPTTSQKSQPPIVIAPTTQNSLSPIVITPITPQNSQPPVVITPPVPQKSYAPVLITPVVSQKSPSCHNAASNPVPFSLAQSLARHVIHRNDESQTVEHWKAEEGITNTHTIIPSSEQEQNSGFSGFGKIASVYSEQDQNNGGNELGLRIDSVYSEQDQNNGGSDLALRIDSVYSEQDQNNGGSDLALRIDSVYSEQEHYDGVGELGLRIDNVFSLAGDENSAFYDGVPSYNPDLNDNSMDTESDSEGSELCSDSEILQSNDAVSFDTEGLQGSDEERTIDVSAQTDPTHFQDFQQNPRKYHFEDEIKQILTERTEERKLPSRDHVTARIEYLPMNTDVTCDELLQPETRLDMTSEEILDSELERILPEMVRPDAVTPSPSGRDGQRFLSSSGGYVGKGGSQRHYAPVGKRCVARKRCTQVSKYFQHRNRLSQPIRRCSVLTPKLVVEEDGSHNDVKSVQCPCGIKLSDIKKEHTKRQKLVNSINHDHTYCGDGMRDMHNTSDVSTDSASSAGYHWSSEDEDGGIHVRGEAILEVITVTPETVLADSTLKNILWAPLRKKRQKKLKPSPKSLSVIQKSHIQSKIIYTKDRKNIKTFHTDSVKAEGKAPTVVVCGVEWNVEPKQPRVNSEYQDKKSFGWVLSKDEGCSLDDRASLTTGSRVVQTCSRVPPIVQTCSGVPPKGKQKSAETPLPTESSHNATISNKVQNTKPKVVFKLVLKRENNAGWTISGRDASQEHVQKDHRCESLAEIKANKESEANKETPVKDMACEKPQREQTCSTAVGDDTGDKINLNMPRGRPRKHPKHSKNDKHEQRHGSEQHMSCSSHSDSQDSIVGEQQASTESEVDEKAHDNKQQSTGKEATATNNCSNDHMVLMCTEKPLNGEQQSAMEEGQGCAYESDADDGSDSHVSSKFDDKSATLPQNIGNTLLQNEKNSPKVTSSDATNLDIPEVRKRGRPRRYIHDTEDEPPKRKCKRLTGSGNTNGNVDIALVRKRGRPRKYRKDTADEISKCKSERVTSNDSPMSEDLPSEPPLGLDLSPECKIRVIDLPPEVVGRLPITDDPQSVNQSLVDSLNEILPLINSEKKQANIASDADAFPETEDAKRGLSRVIVNPGSEETRCVSPDTDNSCGATTGSPVKSIEHKEVNTQGNVSATTQGTGTQDIAKQSKTTKGLSKIEQLKAKLKQQEEALQLVRQQREESKKAFESIDML